MPPPVRIIDTIYANVPATAAPPRDPIKLTAMEALWLLFPVLQHVLLFEGADLPTFDAIVQSLRSSLATTLASFVPLAGRLVHLKDTADVAISCSTSDRVKLVVAESDADIGHLAGDEEHDLRLLELLVPEVDMSVLPTAVLAVQATRFQGGVAVGLTVHHGVADGRSLWTFVEAWATACRGETPAVALTFDRSLINLPGVDVRSVLRKLVPNLPVTTPPSSIMEDRTRFTRRTFTLDARDIQRLKQRIVRLGEAHGAPLSRPPSTFVALVALAWTCFVRCKRLALDEEVFLFFFADVRDRLSPPVEAGYIGACLTGRARAAFRGVGRPGRALQDEGRPCRRVEFYDAGNHFDQTAPSDERVRLSELQGLRHCRLWMGKAEQDGAHPDEPRWPGGADGRQGWPWRAGMTSLFRKEDDMLRKVDTFSTYQRVEMSS
ncbi:unnamed protein product [Alopecurus aequalis]